MIPAVLLLTVMILALFEIASRRADLQNLHVHFSIDTQQSPPHHVRRPYPASGYRLFPGRR